MLDRLNAALQDAVKDADFKASLAKLGAEPVSADRATPEALHKLLAAEIAKWGPIIRRQGSTPTDACAAKRPAFAGLFLC